jgi:dolichol-phosphate mannosyltransferase
LDLSVIIPALHEGPNVAVLLPQLRQALAELGIQSEILVISSDIDGETLGRADPTEVRVIAPREPGYGGALLTGFAVARGQYILTMDADTSHPPVFIHDLWSRRLSGEIIIASRYVAGGQAQMPAGRYLLSRVLNIFFSRGLSLPVRDLSSGFRLYQAQIVQGPSFIARDLDILQEILVRAYADGWQVHEIPFTYVPRQQGSSGARVLRFGLAYLKTFWVLWNWRNSILAADYDDRAYYSPIVLQRYWQRQRFRHLSRLIAQEGPVLDVGCGSSRILEVLPPGSAGVDILLRKLRYARKFPTSLVQGSGFSLPFEDGAFPCILCSQVIEHVPKTSSILDELFRVLKPGGRLVLGTPDYDRWEWVWMERLYGWFAPGGYADEHITHYTRRDLVHHFQGRGFTLEAVHYILRGELILAFRKPLRTTEGQG